MKKLLLLIGLAILSNIIGNAQTWKWLSPLPQGESINCIDFVDANTGYMVTSGGAILKTTDNGLNWEIQESSNAFYNELYSVSFTDINTGYIVGEDLVNHGIIQKTTNGGITWTPLIYPYVNRIFSVFFYDQNIGFTAGYKGKILKTTDAGANWTWQAVGTNDLLSICFTDLNNGFIVGKNGTILKTTNCGTSWTNINLGITDYLSNVFFIDNNNGYIVGDNIFLKTTDGGNVWDSIISGVPKHLYSVYFTDINNGFCVGNDTIIKTTNGGNTWTCKKMGSQPYQYKLNSIYFTDNNTGYIAGYDASIYKTTDAGNSWFNLTHNRLNTCGSLYFTSKNTGYIVGYEEILKSTDGGNNWINQYYAPSLYLSSVFFVNSNIGYAGGSGFLKTTDGGTNWTSMEGLAEGMNSVFFINESTGFVGYEHMAKIFKTTDGGINWCLKNSASTTNKKLNSIFFPSPNIGYAVGYEIVDTQSKSLIYKSTNGGETWNNISPGYWSGLNSVYFIDEDYGYAVGTENLILRTIDGGETWSGKTIYPWELFSVFFVDNNIGYISADNGEIYRTTNSGNSWERQITTISFGLQSIFFPDVNTGYGINRNRNYLMKTSFGDDVIPGQPGTPIGLTALCKNPENTVYTATGTTNATSYLWSVSPMKAGTISGTGLTGDINWNDTWTGIAKITVRAQGPGGFGPPSEVCNVVISTAPIGGSINGNSNICLGDSTGTLTLNGYTGTINKWQKRLNSGIWTDIANTSNTYSEIPSSAGTWNYRAEVLNGSCSIFSGLTTVIVMNSIPANAGTISGSTVVCPGQNGIVYSITPLANTTSYIWTLPIGATGTSTTNTISVNYANSTVSGNITVKGNNACGDGGISTLAITVNPLPINAGPISGNTSVCQGQNNVTYTIPSITYATSHIWTLPSGATGSSTTNSITVNYGINAISGNITVKGNNSCGNGGISSLAIIVNPLPINTQAISGNTSVCHGQNNVTYTVPSITNATSYIWTLPTGATGTSSTNSITVNFGINAVSGNISVKGHNSCGDGGISSLAITVNDIPATPTIIQHFSELTSNAPSGNQWYLNGSIIPGATYQNHTCLVNGNYFDIVTLNGCSSDTSNIIYVTNVGIEFSENNKTFKIYPNPVNNELVIEINGTTENTNFEILNSIGQLVFKGKLLEKTIVNTTTFSPGVYMIKFENGKTFEFKKMLKE